MNEWKLGDLAIARIALNIYAKVKIVKCEDGTFWGNKVLGFQQIEDGSSEAVETLCYFVQVCRTGDTMWVPASALRLAERARPFYGQEKRLSDVPLVTTRKRKIKEDITVSLNIQKVLNIVNPDKNMKYDHKHNPSTQQQRHQGSFRDFVKRRLRLMYMLSQETDNGKCRDVKNVSDDLSVEDYYIKQNLMAFKEQNSFENAYVCKDKSLHKYLYHGWRFKREMNKLVSLTSDGDEEKCSSNLNKSNTSINEDDKHNGPSLPWCLVCGMSEDLDKCSKCPASCHRHCAKQWFTTMLHRKNLPTNIYEKMSSLRKQVSSTRSIEVQQHKFSTSSLCPSCQWGPMVSYGDIVWQKMKSYLWWPARILSPGFLPSCLVTNRGQSNEWAVRYYGTNNYSWCDHNSVVLFLPQQANVLLDNEDENNEERHAAIMDACDDYLSVYLS